MDKKVLSLGAIAMDVVLNSYELPKDDGFALIHHEEMLPGGSASNVSVACASLGMEAYQTGKIGDDEVGSQFRKTLVADHVDDRYVVTPDRQHPQLPLISCGEIRSIDALFWRKQTVFHRTL